VMKFFVVGRKRNMRSLGFKSLIAKGGLQLRVLVCNESLFVFCRTMHGQPLVATRGPRLQSGVAIEGSALNS
jgi:hypothetical protein